MRQSTVELIAETVERDDIGQEYTETASSGEVYCTVDSVTREEWRVAYQAGWDASAKLIVSAADYGRERVAIFEGLRYVIYRTYRDGMDVELYLGERVGERSGTT